MTVLFANNALSTLAGSINAAVLSATLSPGTGALFPNPTGGNYFLLTFSDAATGLLNEIVKVTARSGDVVTIVRAQEGTTAQSWTAGDTASALITAGALGGFAQSANGRTRLTGNVILYVATTGNDVTGDGTIGNPWATAQHASDYVQQTFDLAGKWNVTIQRAAGTYTDAVSVNGPYFGATGPGSVTFTNDGGAVAVNTAASTYLADNGASFNVTNQGITSSANYGLVALRSSYITHQGNNFGNCSAAHIAASISSTIENTGAYTVSGSSQSHLVCSDNGVILMGGAVTVTGTPAFSTAFATASANASIFSSGATFSGAATGLRYSANLNGVINTSGGGANYFPGATPGTTTTGGQYN